MPYLKVPGPSAKALHERSADRLADKRFYASKAWRDLRRAFLTEHPLCEGCKAKGIARLAEHVHHRRGRKAHPELTLDWGNLEALCAACHNEKTGRGE